MRMNTTWYNYLMSSVNLQSYLHVDHLLFHLVTVFLSQWTRSTDSQPLQLTIVVWMFTRCWHLFKWPQRNRTSVHDLVFFLISSFYLQIKETLCPLEIGSYTCWDRILTPLFPDSVSTFRDYRYLHSTKGYTGQVRGCGVWQGRRYRILTWVVGDTCSFKVCRLGVRVISRFFFRLPNVHTSVICEAFGFYDHDVCWL